MNKYIISEKVKNDYNIPDTDAEKSLASITEDDIVEYVKNAEYSDFGMEDGEVINRAVNMLNKYDKTPNGLLSTLMEDLVNDDCVEEIISEVGDMVSELYRRQRERRDETWSHSIDEKHEKLIFNRDEPLIGVTVGEFLDAVDKSYNDEGDMKNWEDNALITKVRYNLDSTGLLYDLDKNISQTIYDERGSVEKKK